jgi:endonuclease G, mitochondrial
MRIACRCRCYTVFVMVMSTLLWHCGSPRERTSSSSSLRAVPQPVETTLKMPIIGGYNLDSNTNTSLGYPPNVDVGDVVISRPQYVLEWSDEHRSPRWAAWRVAQEDLGSTKRQNNFEVDPELSTFLQARSEHAVEPHEYKGSCFDRGHQVPSGDRTSNPENNSATFYMSNMLPQTAYLNRQPWRLLEEYTRSVVRSTGEVLYVVAGPIYDGGTGFIGPNQDIPIPSRNFKIIVALPSSIAPGMKPVPRLIASVIMPNLTSNGTDPVSDHEQACSDSANGGGGGVTVSPQAEEGLWRRYEVSVDQIEQESGLSFAHLQ